MPPRDTTPLAALVLASLLAGCSQTPPDTRDADVAAIRAADSTWSTIAQSRQLDAHVAYFLDDAVLLAPNEPMATGKGAIQQATAALFALPGFSIRWQAVKVEVARSGDLGYSLGNYDLSLSGPGGAPVTDRGKYTTVWKKAPDGTWKVASDMFNSDLAPAPAPAPAAK